MDTPHNNYALIAYKPDGFQICMGCTTGTFGSSFLMHTTLSIEECVKKHAELRRVTYDDQEPEWDITVLYRGVPIREVGGPIYDIYMASLEQEIEDQNEAAVRAAVEAERVRQQQALEEEAQRQETKNAVELQTFFATAKRLNFEVIPHQTEE